MVKGERALSAEEQEALCLLIKRHIDTHVSGSPVCLLTFETKKHEEVVTKGVLKKHKEILVQMFVFCRENRRAPRQSEEPS